MEPVVSVIIPLYNEEIYVYDCIESLLKQDFDKKKMEWIFVDGYSEDCTVQIIRKVMKEYPKLIRLYFNPKRIVSSAMNIGIREARGKYIIRIDAHAEYAVDYISKCVYYLDTSDADNVGGVLKTKARTEYGATIAKGLSSVFGVGNSKFRIGGKSGYVDTVPFGAFRKEVFEKYGGYEERLARSEDNELNYRIRKNGGKIFMASDIHLTYYCRDTLKGICRMAFQNGKWNVAAMRLMPGSMGIRHFVPFVFFLSLFFGCILGMFFKPFAFLLKVEILTYAILDGFFSFKDATDIREFFRLFYLYFSFHICYGAGTAYGLCGKVK